MRELSGIIRSSSNHVTCGNGFPDAMHRNDTLDDGSRTCPVNVSKKIGAIPG